MSDLDMSLTEVCAAVYQDIKEAVRPRAPMLTRDPELPMLESTRLALPKPSDDAATDDGSMGNQRPKTVFVIGAGASR